MSKALVTKEEFDIKVNNLLSRSSNQIAYEVISELEEE
tara:strand:- start:431 stop:544 length:114 start_codon:yes stop_codon:yes gene_type:complete